MTTKLLAKSTTILLGVVLVLGVSQGLAAADGVSKSTVWRVHSVVADISEGDLTIDVAGWIDRDFLQSKDTTDFVVGGQITVTQGCENIADPAQRVTESGSFHYPTALVPISVTQNYPSLQQKGNKLAWSTHVSFTSPIPPLPGYYSICPTGYLPVDLTGPAYSITGASFSVYPGPHGASPGWYDPKTGDRLYVFVPSLPIGTTRLRELPLG